MVDADPQAQPEDRLMLRRTASAFVIVIACSGIAAAADLELLPKGHPKARPAERPVQTQPVVPSVPTPQTPAIQAPSKQAPASQTPASQTPAQPQAPSQQPAAPVLKQEAPVRPAPSQQAPAQQAPAQQPTAPQRLQSPATPGEQGKAVPVPVPAPAPGEEKLKDLQPPAMPPATGIESWWQKVVAKAPHCRTFSDGCRTCDTTFTCSSMPIACQPKEFVCTDPASPPSASPPPPSANPSPANPSSK
jgi:hypothetical protein